MGLTQAVSIVIFVHFTSNLSFRCYGFDFIPASWQYCEAQSAILSVSASSSIRSWSVLLALYSYRILDVTEEFGVYEIKLVKNW